MLRLYPVSLEPVDNSRSHDIAPAINNRRKGVFAQWCSVYRESHSGSPGHVYCTWRHFTSLLLIAVRLFAAIHETIQHHVDAKPELRFVIYGIIHKDGITAV